MLKHMKKSTNVKLTGFLCAAAFMATGIVNAQDPPITDGFRVV